MRTESKKSYSSGFFVPESELRRVVDTLATQFEKGPCSTVPSTIVEITFRNGSISETSKLDDLFQLENGGSGTIERLNIRMKPVDGEPERCTAEVSFRKPDENEPSSSIKYVLQGSDRDWVFVTSSLLEERLNRVKRFNFGSFASLPFFSMLTFFAIFATVFVVLFREIDAIDRGRDVFVDSVKAEWRRGAFKDPIQAMVRVEEIRADSRRATTLHPPTVLLPLVLSTLVMLGVFVIAKVRLRYTFYWGEAANTYDRHAKIANFVGVVLVLGIVISVVGEVVANWFTGG